MKNFLFLTIFFILTVGNYNYSYSEIKPLTKVETEQIMSDEVSLRELQQLTKLHSQINFSANKQNAIHYRVSNAFIEVVFSDNEEDIESFFLNIENLTKEVNLNFNTLDTEVSKIKNYSNSNLSIWKPYFQHIYNSVMDSYNYNKDLNDLITKYINRIYEFDYEDENIDNLFVSLDYISSEITLLGAKNLETLANYQEFNSINFGNRESIGNIFALRESKYMLIGSKLGRAGAIYLTANNIPTVKLIIDYSNQAKKEYKRYLSDQEESFESLEKAKSRLIIITNKITAGKKNKVQEIINLLHNYAYQALYYQNELLKIEMKYADFYIDNESLLITFPNELEDIKENITTQQIQVQADYLRYVKLMNDEIANFQNFVHDNL